MRTTTPALLALLVLPMLGCQGAIDNTGAADPGSQGTGGAGLGCSQVGATQACCTTGIQTCSGAEISTWGPCEDPSGNVLSCCAPGEFGSCGGGGGGLPPNVCKPGEFDNCLPTLCEPGGVNNESEILVGYAQSTGPGGQIKVWVNDEAAEIIAPNEQVDPNTGLVVTPGDRTATAPDGYLWEPALYIAPQSAENHGTPHFPIAFKGSYNNTTVKGAGKLVPGMDPAPAGSTLPERYTTEVIWDAQALGLSPGTYIGEFVIHDGDKDRAVGCLAIVVE